MQKVADGHSMVPPTISLEVSAFIGEPQLVPLNKTTLPLRSRAAQNEVVGHEIAQSSPVESIFVGALQVVPL